MLIGRRPGRRRMSRRVDSARLYVSENVAAAAVAKNMGTMRLYATSGTMPVSFVMVAATNWPNQ